MCFGGGQGGGAAGGPSSANFGAGDPSGGITFPGGQNANPNQPISPVPLPTPRPGTAQAQTPDQADRSVLSVQRQDQKKLDYDLRDPKTGMPISQSQLIVAGGANAPPPERRKRDQSLTD